MSHGFEILGKGENGEDNRKGENIIEAIMKCDINLIDEWIEEEKKRLRSIGREDLCDTYDGIGKMLKNYREFKEENDFLMLVNEKLKVENEKIKEENETLKEQRNNYIGLEMKGNEEIERLRKINQALKAIVNLTE